MNKALALLATVAAVAFVSPAFAAHDTSAKTEVTKESVDAAGTAHKSKTEVKKEVSKDGSSEETAVTKTSEDPKGLGNKETTKTTDEHKVDKHGKATHHHKEKVDGKTTVDEKTESK